MKIKNARKILLCLRYGIGDLIMETPALDALRRAAPKAHITALGARPALQLLEGDPRVDSLRSVHDWGLEHWGDFGTADIKEKLCAWLEREDFDLILDPSHAVMGMAEAIWSQGSNLFDAGSDQQESALREGKGGLAAIREAVRSGWGVEIPDSSVPKIHLNAADLSSALAFLRRHQIDDETLYAVSPVASSSLKRWPLDRFAQLTDELVESSGGKILLFHGPQRETGAELAGRLRHPRRVVPVGEIHLRQVAALLGRCKLFVGNDTGLMHLAAAVGTPVVALFGPTSPGIYLPGQVPSTGLGGDYPCWRRRTTSFGPPECVMSGHCLEGLRSCIDRVRVREAVAAVHAHLAAAHQEIRALRHPPGAPAREGNRPGSWLT